MRVLIPVDEAKGLDSPISDAFGEGSRPTAGSLRCIETRR